MSLNPKAPVQRKPLYGMFTDIPPRYDLINHLITWGMDKRWRKLAAKECLATHPARVLDLCCGTGDLAITIAKMAGYPVDIRGLDFSQPMLDIAAKKAVKMTQRTITFTQGDASKMPFENAYFDCIGISFAFRNLTYKNALAGEHLAEIVRVLKRAGRCVIAESSQPRRKVIRTLNHFYMKQYTYRVGAMLSGNKAAYRYLADSTSNYFSPDEMREFLLKSGFSDVFYRPLFFGAAGIYIATK